MNATPILTLCWLHMISTERIDSLPLQLPGECCQCFLGSAEVFPVEHNHAITLDNVQRQRQELFR